MKASAELAFAATRTHGSDTVITAMAKPGTGAASKAPVSTEPPARRINAKGFGTMVSWTRGGRAIIPVLDRRCEPGSRLTLASPRLFRHARVRPPRRALIVATVDAPAYARRQCATT